MQARRIHVFLDGYGWSENRDAEPSQTKLVRSASELPSVVENIVKISFFNAESDGDLEYLQDAIEDLRRNLNWLLPEEV